MVFPVLSITSNKPTSILCCNLIKNDVQIIVKLRKTVQCFKVQLTRNYTEPVMFYIAVHRYNKMNNLYACFQFIKTGPIPIGFGPWSPVKGPLSLRKLSSKVLFPGYFPVMFNNIMKYIWITIIIVLSFSRLSLNLNPHSSIQILTTSGTNTIDKNDNSQSLLTCLIKQTSRILHQI